MKKLWKPFSLWMLVISMLALPSMQLCAEEDAAAKPDQPMGFEPETQSTETQSVQEKVDAKTDDEVGEKRKEIISEATAAVAQTRDALQALEDGKTEEALAALEKVTGKLALIIAREPELALAPLDVSVITHDLYATPETVNRQVKAAEKLLEDGAVQAAREILFLLASETRIRTTNVPLATYPDAIKAVVPLIDDGKVDKAKNALQLALNTLVVTEEVIPLPVMRAEALLTAAEELAENDDRTTEQNQKLTDMLNAARNQIKLAQALGYGEKKMFKPIYKEIEAIEQKTKEGKSGVGFFDRLPGMFMGF